MELEMDDYMRDPSAMRSSAWGNSSPSRGSPSPARKTQMSSALKVGGRDSTMMRSIGGSSDGRPLNVNRSLTFAEPVQITNKGLTRNAGGSMPKDSALSAKNLKNLETKSTGSVKGGILKGDKSDRKTDA
jgi:hypothetical protein